MAITTGRLQFLHHKEVFANRVVAIDFLDALANTGRTESLSIGETLDSEPIVVKYKDADNKIQSILAIGIEGELGDSAHTKYHYIDTANLIEDIEFLSGFSTTLRNDIDAEIARATASENYISASTTTLSSSTVSFSSSTVSEINRIDNTINAEIAARKAVDGQTGETYTPNISTTAKPLKFITSATSLNDADIRLDGGIQEVSANSIWNVIINSGKTSVNVEPTSGVIKDRISYIQLNSNNINVSSDYETNYQGKETPHPIHNNQQLSEVVATLEADVLYSLERCDNIHLVKTTTGLPADIKEAYDLVDEDGNIQSGSERILIYKDASYVKSQMGHVGATIDSETGVITDGPSTAHQALLIVNLNYEGKYTLTVIDLEQFVLEKEFQDGMVVNGKVVKVKVADDSEPFLTSNYVSGFGGNIKLSGVTTAINSAVTIEKNRAEGIENNIQTELDNTQDGAGLNNNGAYIIHSTGHYINAATSIHNATKLLDGYLYDETVRANSAESTLTTNLNTLSNNAKNSASTLDTKIDNEITRATNAETTLSSSISTLRTDASNSANTLNTKISDNTNKLNVLSGFYETLRDNTNASSITLNNKIDTEKNRAVNEENIILSAMSYSTTTLDTKIDNEITRATNAEVSINDKINSMDADKDASNGNVITGITQTDGKITEIRTSDIINSAKTSMSAVTSNTCLTANTCVSAQTSNSASTSVSAQTSVSATTSVSAQTSVSASTSNSATTASNSLKINGYNLVVGSTGSDMNTIYILI